MKNKLTKLEALRGFAAIYVVFHHVFHTKPFSAYPKIVFLFSFGQEAVILFFLLSGFVIKMSFERSKDKSFHTYFLKRFLRIYIPLILVFGLNYLLVSYSSQQFINPQWKNLSENLLMLQDVPYLKLHVICSPYLNNIPLWSLSYEWWFYMLFYWIYYAFKAKASSLVFIVAVLSAVTYFFYPFFLNRLLLYFSIWWTGVSIAEVYMDSIKFNVKNLRGPLGALTACLVILLLNAIFNRNNGLSTGIGVSPMLEVRHFSFAIATVLIAIVWNFYRWKYFKVTIGLFGVFAPISYGIYISHYFLMINAPYLNFLGNAYLKVLVGLTICVLFSYVVEMKIYVRIIKLVFKKNKPKDEHAEKILLASNEHDINKPFNDR
jgi:peptidoglycan/LPS O-acetylase OafA/YrhL